MDKRKNVSSIHQQKVLTFDDNNYYDTSKNCTLSFVNEKGDSKYSCNNNDKTKHQKGRERQSKRKERDGAGSKDGTKQNYCKNASPYSSSDGSNHCTHLPRDDGEHGFAEKEYYATHRKYSSDGSKEPGKVEGNRKDFQPNLSRDAVNYCTSIESPATVATCSRNIKNVTHTKHIDKNIKPSALQSDRKHQGPVQNIAECNEMNTHNVNVVTSKYTTETESVKRYKLAKPRPSVSQISITQSQIGKQKGCINTIKTGNHQDRNRYNNQSVKITVEPQKQRPFYNYGGHDSRQKNEARTCQDEQYGVKIPCKETTRPNYMENDDKDHKKEAQSRLGNSKKDTRNNEDMQQTTDAINKQKTIENQDFQKNSKKADKRPVNTNQRTKLGLMMFKVFPRRRRNKSSRKNAVKANNVCQRFRRRRPRNNSLFRSKKRRVSSPNKNPANRNDQVRVIYTTHTYQPKLGEVETNKQVEYNGSDVNLSKEHAPVERTNVNYRGRSDKLRSTTEYRFMEPTSRKDVTQYRCMEPTKRKDAVQVTESYEMQSPKHSNNIKVLHFPNREAFPDHKVQCGERQIVKRYKTSHDGQEQRVEKDSRKKMSAENKYRQYEPISPLSSSSAVEHSRLNKSELSYETVPPKKYKNDDKTVLTEKNSPRTGIVCHQKLSCDSGLYYGRTDKCERKCDSRPCPKKSNSGSIIVCQKKEVCKIVKKPIEQLICADHRTRGCNKCVKKCDSVKNTECRPRRSQLICYRKPSIDRSGVSWYDISMSLLKGCVTCVIALLWCPCIFSVGLCWFITYPVRPSHECSCHSKGFKCAFVKWVRSISTLPILEVVKSMHAHPHGACSTPGMNRTRRSGYYMSNSPSVKCCGHPQKKPAKKCGKKHSYCNLNVSCLNNNTPWKQRRVYQVYPCQTTCQRWNPNTSQSHLNVKLLKTESSSGLCNRTEQVIPQQVFVNAAYTVPEKHPSHVIVQVPKKSKRDATAEACINYIPATRDVQCITETVSRKRSQKKRTCKCKPMTLINMPAHSAHGSRSHRTQSHRSRTVRSRTHRSQAGPAPTMSILKKPKPDKRQRSTGHDKNVVAMFASSDRPPPPAKTKTTKTAPKSGKRLSWLKKKPEGKSPRFQWVRERYRRLSDEYSSLLLCVPPRKGIKRMTLRGTPVCQHWGLPCIRKTDLLRRFCGVLCGALYWIPCMMCCHICGKLFCLH